MPQGTENLEKVEDSTHLTQDQRRARAAWAAIASDTAPKGIKYDKDVAPKYLSYVKSAPTLILTNGLGQCLAFWNSNSGVKTAEERAYKALLKHLSDFITTRIPDTQNDLFEAVINRFDSVMYRRATNEVLAYLSWLKKFAEAEIQKEG